MRRYIVLLLITGTVWAQTGFDKLVLKDGTEYLGAFSKKDKKIIYFKPQGAFAFQPVPIALIQSLLLEDGTFVIKLENKYNRISSAEYEKLSEEEKDVYNENRRKIKSRQLISCTTVGCFLLTIFLLMGLNDLGSMDFGPSSNEGFP